METLIKFSFEDWEKSQFADLVVELDGADRRQLPVVKATYYHNSDFQEDEKQLIVYFCDNGTNFECDVYERTYRKGGKFYDYDVYDVENCIMWQCSDADSDNWLHLYIKVR